MNKYYFKSLLAIPLVLLMGCVTADEEEPSWWEKSKQAVSDIWNTSDVVTPTESLEEFDNKDQKNQENNAQKDDLFSNVWKKITTTLDEVLDVESEKETLPDSAWLGKDKEDSQTEIDKLLDEAVSILSISYSNDTRRRIRKLEQEIRRMKQSISQYRQVKISAPKDSRWETTESDYDEKIKDLNESVKQHRIAIMDLKTQFSQELADIGLPITEEQLDVLLSSVVGDDIIRSSIVYNNVKQISQQLMTLTKESGEDLEISQRYYGMYTVLLKALLHMQEKFISNIDNNYLPKIQQIVLDVQDIKANTRILLSAELNKNRRLHLLANLEAQKLTLQTSALYKKHLTGQRRKIAIAYDKTNTDLKIAQNTYKTVRISGELVNLLRTSQKSFELLLNIQVPDLLIFKNLQMKQEFAILTQKLNNNKD
ncbi:MAG: hypothetical protein KAH84_03390 [Thiomargarita sp.]|nr:hypothetical protein [Thiomargarita sp.]